MQERAPLQSAVRWHTGAASPGVTQKPPSHTMASVQAQQSLLLEQPVRHAPLTHIWPPPQPVLDVHDGCGRSSARQRPSSQRSSGPQSLSLAQAPRQ
jgi:hypothetical protein